MSELIDYHRKVYDSYIAVKENGVEGVNEETAELYNKISKRSRDGAFHKTIESLEQKPLEILEIGTSRVISREARAGDGWSTLFWCDYIAKFGGRIVTCDIDEGAISNCKILTEYFAGKIDIQYVVGDGEPLIDDSFNFFYLDGSDDPDSMYSQYKKIDRSLAHIFCDDFHAKGSVLAQRESIAEPNCQIMSCGNNEEHLMAFFKRETDN
jgi:predicted O-methyltransferase YrrM